MGYEDIKDKGFDHRTTDELLDIASKGGKASGKARRRKADFRKTLNTLLTTKIDSSEWTPLLESLGLDSTLESALNMAMIKKGLSGDVRAYEAVAKYAGQSGQTDADLVEQEARTEALKAKVREESETTESKVADYMDALKEAFKDEPE